MTREYDVTVEGRLHRVVISDEKEALLAAKAAGKASVSLWSREGAGETFLTRHAVESLDDATGEYLEKVVRRELGLPWEIAETRRLRIREFQAEDRIRSVGPLGPQAGLSGGQGGSDCPAVGVWGEDGGGSGARIPYLHPFSPKGLCQGGLRGDFDVVSE